MNKAMKFFSVAALCIAMVAMNGCSKDEELPAGSGKVVVSTTTIGLGGSEASKHLDESGTKVFVDGEEVAVVYENTSSTMVKATVTLSDGDITNGGKSATISVTMTDPKADGTVKFIYPASMANDDGTVNYTNLYNNQDGTMATISSNFDLAVCNSNLTASSELPASPVLTNQLAVLKFTIQNTANSQDMTSSVRQLTLKHGSDIYFVTPATAGLSTFWVAVKPIAAGSGNIDICAAVGKDLYKKTVSSYGTLAAGTFNRIAVGTTQIPGALSGLFLVNGELIYFSQGNFFANVSNGSITGYQFGENQYTIGETSNVNTDYSGYTGLAGLFGWSRSDLKTARDESYYGLSASWPLNDWGNCSITVGGDAANSGWYTPSYDLWTALNGRSGWATVAGKDGKILLPHNFVDPMTNNGNRAFGEGSSNVYTAGTNWDAMEAAGAVFLPSAGCRNYNGNYTQMTTFESGFFYWSSTPSGERYVYALVGPYTNNSLLCSRGHSVRLVHNL